MMGFFPRWRLWLGLMGWVCLAACSPVPSWGPGVVVPEIPSQEATDRATWEHEAFTIEPLAEFRVRGRVLGAKHYRSGMEAQLSPVDLALGWGVMSDDTVLAGLEIAQSGRWYHYRWRTPQPPAPLQEIIISSANMHLIPATPDVRRALLDVEEADVVVLEGALVQVRGPNGWRWRSSLTRKDSGDGACELIWVERIQVERPPGI